MFKYKKVIEKVDLDNELKLLDVFGYKLLDKTEREKTVVLRYEVDNEADDFYSKQDIYKKASKWSIRPLWPMFVFVALSIGLITACLIIYLCNKNDSNVFWYLMAAGIPACVFLIVTVVYTAIKFKSDTHNINIFMSIDDVENELKRIEKKNNE